MADPSTRRIAILVARCPRCRRGRRLAATWARNGKPAMVTCG